VRWLPLVSVAVLAAARRWFRIDAQSHWYDEGISAHQLTGSFPEILRPCPCARANSLGGAVIGGSVNTSTGAIMNGIINSGDAVTYSSF
jgi:hypothetical protein